jgi:hypothetical protein
MTTIIISISLWITSVVGYIIWNLYNKNKKLEKMVVNQQVFISSIKDAMREVNTCANLIDSKLWVQSDPEFLSLMENVKEMQSKMSNFIEE